MKFFAEEWTDNFKKRGQHLKVLQEQMLDFVNKHKIPNQDFKFSVESSGRGHGPWTYFHVCYKAEKELD